MRWKIDGEVKTDSDSQRQGEGEASNREELDGAASGSVHQEELKIDMQSEGETGSAASTSRPADNTRSQAKGTKELTSAPKIIIGDMAVCKPWTPSEIMDMSRKAPNPISRPEAYTSWLLRTCTIYNFLIPDVVELLSFTYDADWNLCKDEFQLPVTENGQWPPTIPMKQWLEVNAIKKCARNRSDFSKAINCVLDSKESLITYIEIYCGVG